MIAHLTSRQGANSSRYYRRPACRPWSVVVLLALAMAWVPHPAAFGALINRKLSHPLVTGEGIREFQISPDGQWVVYKLWGFEGPGDLFSVPIEGGPAVKLNSTIPSDAQVSYFSISPDSRHVLLVAPLDTTGFDELYRVPIEGPANERIKLSIPLGTGGEVSSYKVSPDSRRVVYVVLQDGNAPAELHSVPADGPATSSTKINGTLVEGGSVSSLYQISPDGQRVVYAAQMQIADTNELYNVPIEGPGSAWVKLNGPLVAGGSVNGPMEITPDGSRVVYGAKQLTLNAKEYFSVPIEGPAALGTRISAPQPGGVSGYGGTAISPDSNWFLYAIQPEGETLSLFRARMEGPDTEARKINVPLSGFEYVWGFGISPDSNHVVYSVRDLGSRGELYSVPIDGSASDSVRLSVPHSPVRSASRFEISSDSSWVVFTGTQLSDKEELYSVSITGAGGLTRINGSLDEDEGVTTGKLQISPDGLRVAYTANSINRIFPSERVALFVTPIRGPTSAARQWSGPIVDKGEVTSFEWAPDSNHIVYYADQDTDNVGELYVTYDQPAAARGWGKYE